MDERLYDEIKTNENISLTDLVSLGVMQQMQDSFAKMARMAALAVNRDNVPVTAPSCFTELCDCCRKSPAGLALCENMGRQGMALAFEKKQPVCFNCTPGLITFVAPIMLGDKHIGSIAGGQVFVEHPDYDTIRKYAEKIGVDGDMFVEAAKKVQVVPQAAVDRSKEFLFNMAELVGDMAQKAYFALELGEEAMQAAVQKRDFLANMSHEIRTPMNAVLGMAEMALREPMTDEAREYITNIQDAGKHLLVIINDILDFSKIDSGKMTIEPTVYETEALITELSSVINSRIGLKDIEFVVDVPPDMPVELYGDYVRIQQILLNLLTNAVKFTQSGCIRLTLEFVPKEEDTVIFKASVEDTGNGIKKEDMDKLFTSFQQVDSKRNRSVEGTGLGLTICKRLVELMGGTISVTSEYGVGSTFSVEFDQKVQKKGSLPENNGNYPDVYLASGNRYAVEQVKKDLTRIGCKLIDLSEEEEPQFSDGSIMLIERTDNDDEIRKLANSYKNVTFGVLCDYSAPNDLKEDNIKTVRKPGYSKRLLALLGLGEAYTKEKKVSDDEIFTFEAPEAKILIVDDNPINLSVAKGLMEPLNMKVDTATGAKECINLIQQKKYHLIFMDHMMPGVDGVETTHIIRRMHKNYDDVPIIALTANAANGAKEMFLREGMNDFVPKPIETQMMVEKVREWIPDYLIVPVDPAERKNKQEVMEGLRASDIDIPGLNVKGALDLLRNEKLYIDFLRDYYSVIEDRTKKIRNALDDNDIKTYTIEVHSLKSSSRQIGAEALASFAERLEKAGKENDIETIENETIKLLWDYKALKQKLSVLFADEEEDEADKTLTGEKVENIRKMISKGLEELDFLAMDEAWETLSKYDLSDEEKEIIEKIRASAEEFDTEGCNALLEEWRKKY